MAIEGSGKQQAAGRGPEAQRRAAHLGTIDKAHMYVCGVYVGDVCDVVLAGRQELNPLQRGFEGGASPCCRGKGVL